MTESPGIARSYGCTFGCGNPYDYVVVDIRSGDAIMACTPCYVRMAIDMINAITNPDSPEVAEAVRVMGIAEQTTMGDQTVKPRGHNRPADTPDFLTPEEDDDIITVDQLPEAFR